MARPASDAASARRGVEPARRGTRGPPRRARAFRGDRRRPSPPPCLRIAAARRGLDELAAARAPPAVDAPAPLPAWASAAGIAAPAVRVAVFGGVRGLQATADIAAGDTVVELPVEAALVVRPSAKRVVPDAACTPAYWKAAPWFVRMALLVLNARDAAERGDEGVPAAHRAYAADLPPSGALDTPVSWDEGDLAKLHHGPVIEDVRAQRAAWTAAFERYAAAHPSSPYTRADWDWALASVRSRAFSGPYAGPPLKQRAGLAAALAAVGAASVALGAAAPDAVLNGAIAAALFNLLYDVMLSAKVKWYAMAPVVDLANHSGCAASDMSYEYFRDAFRLSLGGGVAKGDQAFISYGPQGADQLLQWYGFVERANPHDAYRLAWRAPALTTALTAAGVDAAGLAAAREAMGAGATAHAALQASVLAGSESEGRDRGRAPTPSPLHPTSLQALLAAVDAEIAGWPGSVEADDAEASSASAPRAATAAAFRAEKRRTLAKARAALVKAVAKAGRE